MLSRAAASRVSTFSSIFRVPRGSGQCASVQQDADRTSRPTGREEEDIGETVSIQVSEADQSMRVQALPHSRFLEWSLSPSQVDGDLFAIHRFDPVVDAVPVQVGAECGRKAFEGQAVEVDAHVQARFHPGGGRKYAVLPGSKHRDFDVDLPRHQRLDQFEDAEGNAACMTF